MASPQASVHVEQAQDSVSSDHALIVFYDALCGLCDSVVQLLLTLDRKRRLSFAPLGGETAQRLLPQELASVNAEPGTFVFLARTLEQDHISSRSTAAIHCATHLGPPWSWLQVFHLLPLRLRDEAYRIVARHRFRLFGRLQQCRVPDAATRARFLP